MALAIIACFSSVNGMMLGPETRVTTVSRTASAPPVSLHERGGGGEGKGVGDALPGAEKHDSPP